MKLRKARDLPSDDRHIVNAVDHLFNYAFDQRASDIHIEPKRNITSVRLRIDGVLHSIYELPKSVQGALISRGFSCVGALMFRGLSCSGGAHVQGALPGAVQCWIGGILTSTQCWSHKVSGPGLGFSGT